MSQLESGELREFVEVSFFRSRSIPPLAGMVLQSLAIHRHPRG
jgi:hypothetical protein